MKLNFELIYIHEGICGWSYSFNDSLLQLMESLGDQASLQLITASLSPEEYQRQILSLKNICFESKSNADLDKLKVSEAFSKKILDSEFSICNTDTLAKAIIAIQKFYPTQTLNAFIFFQNKLFIDGKDINKSESYLGWFYDLGLDGENLYYFMNGSMAEQKLTDNRIFVQTLGITAFPMLLLKKNNRLHIISKGFQPYEKFWQSISTILKPSEV